MPTIELTRRKIYEDIWDRPIYIVAKEHGISDVGLAKVCRRLDVPTPPQGHWAADEEDRSDPPALPPAPDGKGEAVEIRVPNCEPAVASIAEPSVSVPKTLRSAHPLVASTRDELKNARPNEYGRVSSAAAGVLDVSVSPGQLDRALRNVQALIVALEKIGAHIEVCDDRNGEFKTLAVIENEKVRISVNEPSRQRNGRPDDKRYAYRTYTFVPSGRLEIVIDEYGSTGFAKSARDGVSKRNIEGKLGKLVVGLVACARLKKIERIEREAENSRRELVRQERGRLERIEAYNKWLREDLISKARRHADATMVLDLVRSLEASGRLADANESLKTWATWAKQEAVELDPLANTGVLAEPLSPPADWTPPEQPHPHPRPSLGTGLDRNFFETRARFGGY